jgi:pimeloyl-ACP methyl ester carboxylesterase
VWITLGLSAGIVFVGWSLLAYRARPECRAALRSDEAVAVSRADHAWLFRAPRAKDVGLIFFPGALVEPAAYAPLARTVAAAGYPVLLVELPRRGGFGGADSPEVPERAWAAMRHAPEVRGWVAGGHSRGGGVAASLAAATAARFAGLVLIGTSHPRDFSIAASGLPVTKVYGTRDTVADVDKVMATRGNLPPSARLVRIDGGNHSQFGCYGFQPGDWPATISRDEQQRLTVAAIVEALESARRPERGRAAGRP